MFCRKQCQLPPNRSNIRKQTVVLRQVFRLFQRPAPRQISRCCADDELRQRQQADHEVTLQRLLPDRDDGHIEVFIHCAHRTGCNQLQLNAGKSLQEYRNFWYQLMSCKCGRAQDAQISAGRTIEFVCQGVCILQIRKDAFHAIQILFADFCQHQTSCRSVQQADSQTIFKFRNCAGHDRRSEIQCSGSPGKAAFCDNLGKNTK